MFNDHTFSVAEQHFIDLFNMDERQVKIFRTLIETAELRGWNYCSQERVRPLMDIAFPKTKEKVSGTL